MKNITITGDNAESYQEAAMNAAKEFVKEYKQMGAETVTVKKVTISDRNSKLMFDVLGRVNGEQVAGTY